MEISTTDFMTVRRYQTDDEPMLSEWAQAHGREGFNHDAVHHYGFVCEFPEGHPVMAAFLFLNDSALAFVDCVIGKPGLPAHVPRTAFRALMDRIKGAAKMHGCDRIASLVLDRLVREAERQGFESVADGRLMVTEID